jgi:hypothetical protein
MDAPLTLARLMEEFSALLESHDFEGAEELLSISIGSWPKNEAFLHFQFGRLYRAWNKMSSAVNHLTKAAELTNSAADEILLIQVVEELKLARKRQFEQTP